MGIRDRGKVRQGQESTEINIRRFFIHRSSQPCHPDPLLGDATAAVHPYSNKQQWRVEWKKRSTL